MLSTDNVAVSLILKQFDTILALLIDNLFILKVQCTENENC